MISRLLLLFWTTGFGFTAVAEEVAEHAEHGAEEIPWSKLVIPQMFNFVIFVGLLIYFVRKPIKAHFETKATQFSAARVKAAESKAAAERHHYDVEVQLRHLEKNAEQSIDEAKRESEKLRLKMIADAKAAALRQGEDAAAMAQFEYQRAISALRIEIINAATAQASTALQKRMDNDLRSKLNDDFLKKVKTT